MLLTSCGGHTQAESPSLDSDAAAHSIQMTPVAIPAERLAMARDSTAECVDGPHSPSCSPTVGFVTLVGDEGVVNCTGFLIDSSHVVTNGHCIDHSANIRTDGCSNKIFVHFPESNGHAAESVGCRQIRFRARGETDGTSDFMVMEIDRTLHRPVLPISNTGLVNHEKVSLFVGIRSQLWNSETNQNLLVGKMSKLECTTEYGSLLLPGVQSASDEIMTFANCPIRPGNSGSPILNSSGEIAGLIQATIGLKDDSDLYSKLTSQGRLGEVSDKAIGTQFHCQKGRLSGAVSDFNCRRIPWPL